MSTNEPRPDSNDAPRRNDAEWKDNSPSRVDGPDGESERGADDAAIPEVIPAEEPIGRRSARAYAPPGPGFWGAVLWCITFILVMLLGLAPVMIADLVVQSKQYPDPQAWIQSQLNALGDNGIVLPGLGRSFARGMLAAEVLSLLYALLVVRWTMGQNWPRIVALRLPRVDHLVLCLLALPGLMILHGGAHEVARMLIPPGKGPALDMGEMLKGIFQPWPRWLTVLVIGVGPGISEELWCRGFLGRGLLARYGIVAGVILTSIFFGLLHGSLSYAIGTACMGAALHFIYLTTRSLLVPMLLHCLNNSLTMLLAMGDFNVPNVDPDAPPRLMYLGSACMVAAVFYALYVSRGRLRDLAGGPPRWQPPFPSVALPPPGSGTIVAHEAPSPTAIALVVLGAMAFGLCWMYV
jgi:membrane protease YdiL (CAAX protease family)